MICQYYDFDHQCTNETYTKDGVNNWIADLVKCIFVVNQ
jgi:hypothetical protein